MARLKFYVDENVDVRVAEGLRRRAIAATSALEEGLLGASDEEHFGRATALGAVIFTHDHHFVEMALRRGRRGEEHFGVIFAEMHRLPMGECIRRLALYADVLSAEEMVNAIEFL
ncbi:MAG: DUF5615 family PIN-like protein [Nitrospirae bacterium]|nr:DUF5615 family PIN-like protein [Nitrospirota bacterium]MBI3392670.1 DUF5615 family PIN-like protein [Nitrospirota bacterium]